MRGKVLLVHRGFLLCLVLQHYVISEPRSHLSWYHAVSSADVYLANFKLPKISYCLLYVHNNLALNYQLFTKRKLKSKVVFCRLWLPSEHANVQLGQLHQLCGLIGWFVRTFLWLLWLAHYWFSISFTVHTCNSILAHHHVKSFSYVYN